MQGLAIGARLVEAWWASAAQRLEARLAGLRSTPAGALPPHRGARLF